MRRTLGTTIGWLALAALLFFAAPVVAGKPGQGELELTVNDSETGQPVPCRIHLKNGVGVARKALKMPFWHDYFAFPGVVELKLPRGNHLFVIERGPEYADTSGHFRIDDFSEDRKSVTLKRAVNMADEHWWSGDLAVVRDLKHIELLMQAEDLHVAEVVTWDSTKAASNANAPANSAVSFDGNRCYDATAGEWRVDGAGLAFYHVRHPLELFSSADAMPTPLEAINGAHEQDGAWVDLADPSSPALPVYLALAKLDSFRLAHERFHRASGSAGPQAMPKPAARKASGPSQALGRATEEVYYHALNCGFRLPPTAASASGVEPNPLGYDRMYAWVDKEAFSYEAWWEAVREGRVIVTNGPLIRPLANGRLPGHVLHVPDSGELIVDVSMNLTTRDRLSYLEVVKNGRVAASIRLEEWAKSGHFPPVKARAGDWLLVRVVADVADTYRFASSGPWYVEGAEPEQRISRASVQFFLDRLDAYERGLAPPATRQFDECGKAGAWWHELLARATDE